MSTNDPKNALIVLNIKGYIEAFAKILPSMVDLKGIAGDTITKTVKIIPNQKYPFKITAVTYSSGKFIKTDLKEEKVDGKSQYLLTVENLKKDAGSYYDRIRLKTDSKINPLLSIRVKGKVTEKEG